MQNTRWKDDIWKNNRGMFVIHCKQVYRDRKSFTDNRTSAQTPEKSKDCDKSKGLWQLQKTVTIINDCDKRTMIDKCSIVDIRADFHKFTHFDKPGNRQQEETIFTTTESAACVSPARWLCQVNIKKSGQQDVMEDVATFMAVHTHAPERILPPNTHTTTTPHTDSITTGHREARIVMRWGVRGRLGLQNMFKKEEESEVCLPIASPVILWGAKLFRSVSFSVCQYWKSEEKTKLCVCLYVCVSVHSAMW